MSDYDPSRLSVELVPSTAWWSNVRSNVSRADWEKCKAFVRERSGGRCEICGGVGSRWPVECHEIWDYDDDRQIQTLVDLIALCPDCHRVKHLGRTREVGDWKQWEKSINHLQSVNDWPDQKVEQYVRLVFEIWRMRSTMEWSLDVSYLSLLGINATVKDRP